MPRAVQTKHSPIIHLQADSGKTYCGTWPFCAAPMVVNRINMCLNCFGKGHGIDKWTAQRLGLERIVEM